MTENEVTNLGGKLGPRVAKLVMDAVAGTQIQLGDHKNSLVQKALADFTNHVSDEVRDNFGQVFAQIAENPELPTELKPIFSALANERGQAFAWIGGSIAGTLMSGGLSDLITNWLAPVVHMIIAQNPNQFLTPQLVAAAKARAFEYEEGPRSIDYDALGQGINPERLRLLTELAYERPTINQTQELLNRGIWNYGQAQMNARRLGHSPDWAEDMLALRETLLSPEVLATMVNRDAIPDDLAETTAAKSGVSGEDFARLVEIYGEPLGIASLGEAYRRGIIGRERFLRGVIQGPVRKEWFDVIDKLLYSRMSTVDAADAVNQGHMELAEAQLVAQANGLEPDDFATLIQTAGAPPGVDFITEALNRGFIDTATFNAAFFESRIKNKYVHLFEEMRYRLIPQETVRLLYRNGVYSREATLDTLRKHGFTETDAQALLALEETRQDEGTKELTRSQIIQLYTVRAIDLSAALSMLLSLGYSDNTARMMIELADFTRLRTFVNSAVGRVKAAYLAGRMTESEASAQIDALGVTVDERDDLFFLWDIDKTTISKALTPAQIRQAFKKDLISQGEAVGRLTSQGYDVTDAGLFLQLTS